LPDRHKHPAMYDYTPITPFATTAKSKKKEKKTEKKRTLDALRIDLTHMVTKGHITEDAYSSMISILTEEVDEPIDTDVPTATAPPPVRFENMIVSRTMAPDERPVPDFDAISEAAEAPRAEGEPAPDTDVVPTSEFAPELQPAIAHGDNLEADPAAPPAPAPETADDDLWNFLSTGSRSKKAIKKAKRMKSRAAFLIENQNEEMEPSTDLTKIEFLRTDLHDSGSPDLKEELPITSDVEPDSHKSVAEESAENWSVKGCLFVTCIRCVSMIMIEFKSGLVPSMPLPSQDRVENGILMTTCATCENKSWEMLGTKPNLLDMFKNLHLHPDLLKGSDLVKVATLIANAKVGMMEYKGQILYMDRIRVMEKVSSSDKIMSVDRTQRDTMVRSKLLLTHLLGGFI
jgi:hypothetical protein